MEWYLEHTHGGRFLIRCSGAWGGMSLLPAMYRNELCARMRAAELNRSYLPVLPSFDFECQRERDLFDWAISKYGWRDEGEFQEEGFQDQELYQEDVFLLRSTDERTQRDREALLEQFAGWLEKRVEKLVPNTCF